MSFSWRKKSHWRSCKQSNSVRCLQSCWQGLVRFPGNGSSRQVGVKNEPQEELLRQAMMLRSTIGRKASLILKRRHVQKNPSIQAASEQILQDIQWQLYKPRAGFQAALASADLCLCRQSICKMRSDEVMQAITNKLSICVILCCMMLFKVDVWHSIRDTFARPLLQCLSAYATQWDVLYTLWQG